MLVLWGEKIRHAAGADDSNLMESLVHPTRSSFHVPTVGGLNEKSVHQLCLDSNPPKKTKKHLVSDLLQFLKGVLVGRIWFMDDLNRWFASIFCSSMLMVFLWLRLKAWNPVATSMH